MGAAIVHPDMQSEKIQMLLRMSTFVPMSVVLALGMREPKFGVRIGGPMIQKQLISCSEVWP